MPVDKKTEFVKEWEAAVDLGMKYRKKFSKVTEWGKYRSMYRGDWKKTIVPVNKTYSFLRSLVPRTYFRNPGVAVTAFRPEHVWHSRVVESVDNYLINELNLKYQLKGGILNGSLCGIGPIKLGYDSEFGFIPSQATDENQATGTQIGRKEGDRIEYRVNVKPGMPWAIKVLPESIVTPWGYNDVESLPWIAHQVLRPLDDIKQDQKYQNTQDLTGGFKENLLYKKELAKMESEGVKYGLLTEIRDVKTRSIIVICEGQLLMSQPDALQIEGLPYEFIIFNPDAEHFWPISDVTILEPQQREANEIRTQASRHRRIAVLKLLVKKGLFGAGKEGEAQLEKLLGDDVAAIVEVLSDIPSQEIFQFTPETPTDMLAKEAMLNDEDMREGVGFPRTQSQGMTPPGRTPPSAMEVGVVQQAFEIRTDERRDVTADVLQKIIRKWNQYIFKFWTSERVAQIVGPEGRLYWVKYTGDQLKGEYFLRIDPESGMPISRHLRNMQMEKLFEDLKNDPYIDQVELRKMRLRQIDWLDPSAINLVKPPMEGAEELGDINAMMGGPMVGGGSQGGGMPPIGSPEKPIALQELIDKGRK